MHSDRDLSESNVEKVRQMIHSSNFEDLTPETLLQAYQEEGIRSLEDLTERLTAEIKDPKGGPQRINYEASFNTPTPREILEKIEHTVPQVPFTVKGVEYDPEDIVRFNGKELLFIADCRPSSSELIVLEDKSVWSSILQTIRLSTLLAGNGTVVRHEPRNWKAPELKSFKGLPQKYYEQAGGSYDPPKHMSDEEKEALRKYWADYHKKQEQEEREKQQREGGEPVTDVYYQRAQKSPGASNLIFLNTEYGYRDLARVGWANMISSVENWGIQYHKGAGGWLTEPDSGVTHPTQPYRPSGPGTLGNPGPVRWVRGITDDVYLFSEPDWDGAELEVRENRVNPDLTEDWLAWPLITWNDETESISPTVSACIFGKHIRT